MNSLALLVFEFFISESIILFLRGEVDAVDLASLLHSRKYVLRIAFLFCNEDDDEMASLVFMLNALTV